MPRANLKDAMIVFDLDGTLVYTAPDLTNALNDALTSRGHTPISQPSDPPWASARVRIDEALRRARRRGRHLRCWPSSSSTTKATSALSRAFPGAVASLETLAAAGVKLAVYTNKHEYLSRKLLEALRLGTTSKAWPAATLSQCQNRIPVISLR